MYKIMSLMLGGIILGMSTSRAHVEPKKMLFYANKKQHQASGVAQQGKKNIVSYESRENGNPSKVVSIQGLPAFKQIVLLHSFTKPVIVKVHAIASVESQKVKPHFQDVADSLGQKVSCIAMNLLEGGEQNKAIVAHLLSKCGVHRVDLPLFLFFKNGQLQLPVRQGFHNKENLTSLIQKEFFNTDKKSAAGLQNNSPNAALCGQQGVHLVRKQAKNYNISPEKRLSENDFACDLTSTSNNKPLGQLISK
jgi:hypothetical protein